MFVHCSECVMSKMIFSYNWILQFLLLQFLIAVKNMHNLLQLASPRKRWQPVIWVIRQHAPLFLLFSHLFSFLPCQRLFCGPWEKATTLAWFPLFYSFFGRKATSSHFKRNPLRFVCVVISIKLLEVHFFNDNIWFCLQKAKPNPIVNL